MGQIRRQFLGQISGTLDAFLVVLTHFKLHINDELMRLKPVRSNLQTDLNAKDPGWLVRQSEQELNCHGGTQAFLCIILQTNQHLSLHHVSQCRMSDSRCTKHAKAFNTFNNIIDRCTTIMFFRTLEPFHQLLSPTDV